MIIKQSKNSKIKNIIIDFIIETKVYYNLKKLYIDIKLKKRKNIKI